MPEPSRVFYQRDCMACGADTAWRQSRNGQSHRHSYRGQSLAALPDGKRRESRLQIFHMPPPMLPTDTTPPRAFILQAQILTPIFGRASKGLSLAIALPQRLRGAGQGPHCAIINDENTELICRLTVA